MKKITILLFIVVMFCLLPVKIFSQEKIIYLASLDWPPYIGENLPEQGVNAIVVHEAFAAMGYKLRIEFYPWARTLMLAKKEEKYAGYFPEYYAKEIEKDFTFSDPIGDSPLGFVERKNEPVSWNTLDDLKNMKIGTVRGYVNTEEFDKKAAEGILKVEEVKDDATNLRKVAGKRIPLAVIDKYVMQYLLKTDKTLADKKILLQFQSKLLENKKLYICFRKNQQGEQMVKIFNDGLKKINADRIIEEYFKKMPD